MSKAYLAEMTWREFRQALQEDPVVVVPLGTTELEGDHLPLGVDTFAAQGVARGLAGQPGVVIGPCLPVGYSKWFLPFPGTISLEHDTLVRVLLDYCRSLIGAGASRLVFLNAHKGNNSVVEVAAHQLMREHPVKVGMINVWKLAGDFAAQGDLIAEGKFTHAGEVMTSMMLELRPDTVDMSQAKPGKVKPLEGAEIQPLNSIGDAAFQGMAQTLFRDIRQVTDHGILGDPTTATADKGRKMLELITDYAKGFLQEFRRI